MIYALGDDLLAAPFDVERMELTGGPVPMVEDVSRADLSGAANADVSRTGTLVYVPASASGDNTRTLVWVDRTGSEKPVAVPAQRYVYPRLSPDGALLAVAIEAEDDDLWVLNLTRGTSSRLTFTPEPELYAVWTPDGQHLIFGSRSDGDGPNLYRRAVDGTGEAERLTESPDAQEPMAISPNGTQVVFRQVSSQAQGSNDLHLLSLDAPSLSEPLLANDANEWNADIAPDGEWMAYESNASGRLP